MICSRRRFYCSSFIFEDIAHAFFIKDFQIHVVNPTLLFILGTQCEVNIDECEPKPCQNGGECVDLINNYECICDDTGFMGAHCEINIDECESNPCVNNATCIDLINDYDCNCYLGYEGKNCEQDIAECEAQPCQNNASCYEKSDVNSYDPEVYSTLPENLQHFFTRPFSYDYAEGYVCNCMAGYEGKFECWTLLTKFL